MPCASHPLQGQRGAVGKGRTRLSQQACSRYSKVCPWAEEHGNSPQRKNMAWGTDILGCSVAKALAGWISYSFSSGKARILLLLSWKHLFVARFWASEEQHLPKWPCVPQQAVLEGLQQGRTSVGGLCALSRANLWLQMPSFSLSCSADKPAKAPITRSFPFPGAGDLPGGIHIPAFLRQRGAWVKTYFSLDSPALFTWLLCQQDLHQSSPSRLSGEMQTKFLQSNCS